MIIFLYGQDTFRSRQKLNQLKEKFIREVDPSGNDLIVLDGENMSLNDVNKAFFSMSLFAKKRMVVIENIFANKKTTLFPKLLDILKKAEKGGDNIVVIREELEKPKGKNSLFEFLSKQKYAQNFAPLSNAQIINWLKQEAARRGAKIQPLASSQLAALVGNDLWQLENEIAKLSNYKSAKQKPESGGASSAIIEKEDVDLMVRGKADENIFALTDAISGNNKAQALELFEKELEAGVAEMYLLTMIVRQFRIMLQVRQALDEGQSNRQIISLLKLHPFVVQKTAVQARNFTMEKLKNIFSQLAEIDKNIKTGKSDFKSSISLLIMKI